MLYVGPDGTITDMKAVYRDGGMVFVTDHFSVYVMAEEASSSLAGDMNGDGEVTIDDAIYLLYHALLGAEQYPIEQSGDVNGDGSVDIDDAIYLLYHALLGAEQYPLR